MNSRIQDILLVFSRFHGYKKWLPLIVLAVLAAAAVIELSVAGLVRRTFAFYTVDGAVTIVESRMLRVLGNLPVSGNSPVSGNRRSLSREVNIVRYVEEALLGPVSPNSLPLFPNETRLLSLMYRDGVVYTDLSESAALPPIEGSPQGGGVLTNFKTLHAGIRRNFPFVRDVRFFIAGKAAYAGDFR
jgi:hypothetical protein